MDSNVDSQAVDHASPEEASIRDLVQLHTVIQGKYTLNELEQLLPCFDIAEIDWDVGVDTHVLSRAYAALVILLEVAVSCEGNHTMAAETGERLLSSLNGILFWMCAVLKLHPRSDLSLPEGIVKLDVSDDPKPHDVFASVLVRLADLHPSLENLIIFHPLVLDLSLFWWVAARDGHPLLYTSGLHNPTLDDESGRDAITNLAYLISCRNSLAFATVIQRGEICSPELFFTRASERMKLLVCLRTLPHLKHARANSLETDNFQCIVGVTNTLICADGQLVFPLLKTAAPRMFMEGLVAARLQGLFAEFDSGASRRAEIEGDILNFARIVAEWVSLSSHHYVSIVKGFVSNRGTRITHLLRDFISVYTTTSSDANQEPFDILFGCLLHWALASPTALKHVHDALQTDLPKIGLVSGSIAPLQRSGRVVQGISMIMKYSMYATSTQFEICDNANHWALPKNGQPEQGYSSKTVCSGCTSVTYCCHGCQREDWNIRHRNECGKMRADYFRVKHSKGLPYSQRLRAFHVAILQSSHARSSTVFRPSSCALREPWSRKCNKSGRKLVLTIDMADVIDPVSIDPIPEFVKATIPLIPKHLLKRFKDLIEAFIRSDDGSRADERSLVNGTFYYGDVEVNHLLLVQRVADAQDKSAGVKFIGSLMYTCPTRDRFAIRGGVQGHAARNHKVLNGSKVAGLENTGRRTDPVGPQRFGAVMQRFTDALRIGRRQLYQTANSDDAVSEGSDESDVSEST